MRAAFYPGHRTVWLAMVLTAVHATGLAAAQPLASVPETAVILDRVLDSRNELQGRVVDSQGVAQAQRVVRAQAAGQEAVTAITDTDGQFVFSGLRGGVYSIGVDEDVALYRVWTRHGAPPAAREGVLIVTGGEVARGKLEITPYTVTLTAVAIGVGALLYSALENDDAS